MFSPTLKNHSFFLLLLTVLILAASSAIAQDKVPQVGGANVSVTASATSDGVRFAAPSAVVQLRLEVYDGAGQKLVDTEQRGGNVLDWHLHGGNGERVADGTYLFVVTIKNLSGRLSQKLGSITVSAQSTTLHASAVTDLNAQQAQAVGPIESGEEGLSVLPAGDAQPVTVLATNDTEAQLARTRGALTFRFGDFFSGNDQEQMRLTREGNVGIGTSEPKAKLDVAGTIRAQRFLVARPSQPGSASPAQAGDSAQATDATDSVQPLISGVGTQNHIAKWTDPAGTTLGDSGIVETAGGNVGIGTTPTVALDIYGKFKINNDGTGKWGASGAQGLLSWDTNLAIIGGYAGNSLGLFANNTQYATLTTTGRFGIGTTVPNSLLEIKSAVPVLSINGTTSNSFRGLTFLDDGSDFGTKLTANASTGELRDSVGPSVGWGGFRTFYTDTTEKIRITSGGNVGIGTTNPQSKLDVAGDIAVLGNAVISGNIAAKYQDVAEWVPSRQEIAAGTVVILDVTQTNAVSPSRRAYDTLIAGVVSAQPGVLLGKGGPGKVMVATTGRVIVKVDASKYPIKVGDLLVTSSHPGEAMKSRPIRVGGQLIHRPGTIIGKALEPLSNGKGKILVLLSLQ
ncbi:MAG TPA: hypothetical protein DC054_14870 [Blastocatellia bacterium]|nr:hypothetical protein [Blastocatellia bacterium]